MSDLKQICLDYFTKHPQAKSELINKAAKLNEYELIYPLIERKKEIEDVIFKEESNYFKLVKNAEKIVKNIKFEDLTGELLCKLHHTHGIDPCIVEDILNRDLPSKLHDEYRVEYEKHKNTGKLGLKKEIIQVK